MLKIVLVCHSFIIFSTVYSYLCGKIPVWTFFSQGLKSLAISTEPNLLDMLDRTFQSSAGCVSHVPLKISPRETIWIREALGGWFVKHSVCHIQYGQISVHAAERASMSFFALLKYFFITNYHSRSIHTNLFGSSHCLKVCSGFSFSSQLNPAHSYRLPLLKGRWSVGHVIVRPTKNSLAWGVQDGSEWFWLEILAHWLPHKFILKTKVGL